MANMKDVNNEKGLVECGDLSGQTNSANIDPVPGRCNYGQEASQKHVAENPPLDWTTPPSRKKLGTGQHGNCDPLQTGQIVNDPDDANRNVIYRYSNALYGADEAMVDLFRNIKVIDEDGKWHVVPIHWASQEQAVAAILQDNVRKDNSLVVDRIRLPMMAIYSSAHSFDPTRFTYQRAMSLMPWLDPKSEGTGFTATEKYERDTVFGVTRGIPVNITYTLYIWTLYQTDMNQILEQVFLRFSPVAYLRIRGVYWEVIVTMDGQANNLDVEPGDRRLRVLKYQFTMTAKSYIPQPITRVKPPEPIAYASTLGGDDLKRALEILEKIMAEKADG